uniref:Septin 15 n=1 Tax=Neolamprologus brichardi TaxID=32507 RepID=A0A3Q4N797_NEOBR
VENGEHCDFTVLRNMLIRTHMQDLKDVTNNVHYENYRSKKLAAVTCNGVDTSKTKGQSPLAQMEEERREHVMKMKKMEAEMEQVFEMKVKEKKQKLKDSEAELERRHEQMKRNLEAQYKELEEKRRVVIIYSMTYKHKGCSPKTALYFGLYFQNFSVQAHWYKYRDLF